MSLPGTVDPERRVSLDSPVMRGWDGVELAPYLARVATPRSTSPTTPRRWPDRSCSAGRAGKRRPRRQGLDRARARRHRRWPAGQRAPWGDRRARTHPGRRRGRPAVPVRRDRLPGDDRRWLGAGGPAHRRRESRSGTCATWWRSPSQGDPRARNLLRESGRYVGEVLSVAVNLLNPQTVVIGGDMGAAFDLYSAGVRESGLRPVHGPGHPRAAVRSRDPRRLGRSRGLRGGRDRARAERGRRRCAAARPA